ncbi:MAG: hypothetical protein KA004_15335 [Verrucomicrobiales bacterium]|nr:hypothetical protein [Verrucomicrobiales bacterium]
MSAQDSPEQPHCWRLVKRDGCLRLELSRVRFLLLWLMTVAVVVLLAWLVAVLPTKHRSRGIRHASNSIALLVGIGAAVRLRRQWQRERAAGICLLELDVARQHLRLPRNRLEIPFHSAVWAWCTDESATAPTVFLTNSGDGETPVKVSLPLATAHDCTTLTEALADAGIGKCSWDAA